MHVLIVLRYRRSILLAARPQVADIVKVELVVAVCEGPHPNVELSVLEQERLLDVLLNDPIRELKARLQESNYLTQVIQDLDSFTLILVGRFDEPNVPLAVLLRQLFFDCVTITVGQVLISLDELGVLVFLQLGANNEGGWHCVKDLVALLYEMNCVFIVVLERTDEASLGRQISVTLQVIDNNLPVRITLVLQ